MKRCHHQLFDQMPDRALKSVSSPPNSLRRSPRLLRRNPSPDPPDPKTPWLHPDPKSRRARHPPAKNSKRSGKSEDGPRESGDSPTGLSLRRSPRLSALAKKAPDRTEKAEAKRRSPVPSKETLSARAGEREVGTRCVVVGLAAPIMKAGGQGDERKTRRTKRKREEEGPGSGHGWTDEQEMALQRAYLVAKPTPSFWKKVSKLVPGKSAQECFDKINCDLATPQPRSRLRTANRRTCQTEPSPLSASKILNPVKANNKVSGHRKTKGHLVHRTARQLSQKHYQMDQTAGGDLFSILEPEVDPSAKVLDLSPTFSTPETAGKLKGTILNFKDRTSSTSKKPLSRFHGSDGIGKLHISPPVLKPVKNRALHEKYLDQLHSRETRRNAASVRNKTESGPKINAVQAAKEALVSDVRDAIHRLQDLRDSPGSDSCDLMDRGNEDEDDEADY